MAKDMASQGIDEFKSETWGECCSKCFGRLDCGGWTLHTETSMCVLWGFAVRVCKWHTRFRIR
jgi:hypothetical protein